MESTARRSGTASRKAILSRALALSAERGPGGVSIGVLAHALGMSKSGVFAHFGSKDALDLAVVDAAADAFTRAVMTPAQTAPPGVARLAALVEGWLGEVRTGSDSLTVLGHPHRGAAEAVRSGLDAWRARWRKALAAEVAAARQSGELGPAADPAHTAFEIHALLSAAASDAEAGARGADAAAGRAIEIRLQQLAAEP